MLFEKRYTIDEIRQICHVFNMIKNEPKINNFAQVVIYDSLEDLRNNLMLMLIKANSMAAWS